MTIDHSDALVAVSATLQRLAVEVRIRQDWPYLPENGADAREVLHHLEAELTLALSHLSRLRHAGRSPHQSEKTVPSYSPGPAGSAAI